MATSYISIRTLLSEIADLLDQDESEMRWHSMIEWIARGMQRIGAHSQYERKTARIQVEDYAARLPCGCFRVEEVRSASASACHKNAAWVAETGSSRLEWISAPAWKPGCLPQEGYRVVGDAIEWFQPEALLEIDYLAMPVDEEGFPLIPDNPSYSDALFWWVVRNLSIGGAQFRSPEMGFALADAQWRRLCVQARASQSMPSSQDIERWASIMGRLPQPAFNARPAAAIGSAYQTKSTPSRVQAAIVAAERPYR